MLKLKLQYFGLTHWKWLDAGKDWSQEKKGMTEDEMIGWHHRLDGHEFEQGPGVGDGQGGLVCCSLWGPKESDMTEQLNWTAQTFLYSPLITNTQIRTQTSMHLDLHPRKTKFRDLGYMYHNLGYKRSPHMHTNIWGKLHLILRNRHLKVKNKCD